MYMLDASTLTLIIKSLNHYFKRTLFINKWYLELFSFASKYSIFRTTLAYFMTLQNSKLKKNELIRP